MGHGGWYKYESYKDRYLYFLSILFHVSSTKKAVGKQKVKFMSEIRKVSRAIYRIRFIWETELTFL